MTEEKKDRHWKQGEIQSSASCYGCGDPFVLPLKLGKDTQAAEVLCPRCRERG